MRRLKGIKGFITGLLCIAVVMTILIANWSGRDWDADAAGAEAVSFSQDSGCYSSAFGLTMTASEGAEIYYTTDGSVPNPGTGTTRKYSGSVQVTNLKGSDALLTTNGNASKFVDNGSATVPRNKNDLDRAFIVRAVAKSSEGIVTPVSTRTYFINNDIVGSYGKDCPVLSIVTDPDNLLNDDTGIYVTGSKFAQDGNIDSANFMQKGRDWERSAYLDFFDGTDKPAVSTGIGIRIHGGYTRRNQQKSMNIYFRSDYDYGTKSLKGYELITGAVKTYYDKTKEGATAATMNFSDTMIRNGGNDADITKFQDVFIQSMVTDKNFTTQTTRPCMVYLNGEYWGLYNLTEKYSDKYIEEEFDVDNKNVLMYKNLEIDEGEELDPDKTQFNELMDLGKLDMTKEENYQKFQDIVDIDSFVDYYATEVYINNNDWWSGCNEDTPNNNIQFWKVSDPSKEDAGNPYADGKWRYMLYDTEWSMNLWNNQETRPTYDSIKYHAMGLPDPSRSAAENNRTYATGSALFTALFKNTDFLERFTNTLLDIRNWNYKYERCVEKLDELERIYRPLWQKHSIRWNTSSYDSNRINVLKSFISDRNDYIPQMIEDNISSLSSDKRVNVTVTANLSAENLVKVNTVTPDIRNGWTGLYYRNYPITVSANEENGHKFSHWEVSGGTAADAYSAETEITLTSSNASVEAVYSDGGSAEPDKDAEITTDDGYIVEYAIPFATNKSAGAKVGLEVQINDCTAGSRYGTLNMFAETSPYNSGAEFGTVTLSNSATTTIVGDGIQAIKADRAIAVDGLIDDTWSKARTIKLNNFQPDNNGIQHCNANAKVMWDDKNLYVLVVVEDSDLAVNSNTYQSDSVEIFYDDDAANPIDYTADMFQYRTLYNGTNEYGKKGDNSADFNVSTAASLIGYTVEYAVPFKSAKSVGDKASFEIQVIDSIKAVTTQRIGKLNLFATASAYSDRTQFGAANLCEAYPVEGVTAGANAINAIKASNEIKIDGIVDSSWSKAAPITIAKYTPKEYTDSNGDSQTVEQQINAQARVMWDADNLYILVTVVDTDRCRNDGAESDCVELFFDENSSATSWDSQDGSPVTAFQYRTYYDGATEEGRNCDVAQYAVKASSASSGKLITVLPAVPTAPPATPVPTATVKPTVPPDQTGYKAEFVVDSHASITVYKTQDYTDETGILTNQTSAVSRDSDMGNIVDEGGQINFTVVPAAGYIVDTVDASPAGAYKNLKLPADTGKDNTYRVTKITGDLAITVTTKSDGSSQPGATEVPVTSYKADFEVEGGASITTYMTQDYKLDVGKAENQTSAFARNSDTGVIDVTGDGQINFTVVPKTDYVIDTVEVSPGSNYKNLKLPADTGEENTYRVTKVKGDIVIKVTMKYTGLATATPTGKPTSTPANKPTSKPTATPTSKPTATPTSKPADKPTAKPTAIPSDKPTEAPSAEPTPSPATEPTPAGATQTPEALTPSLAPATKMPDTVVTPTAAPEVQASPTAAPTKAPVDEADEKLQEVDELKVGKFTYTITGENTVEFTAGSGKSASSIVIPATVTIQGKNYKVTSIGEGAFKNYRKLKKITIGKNIRAIGKNAFFGCSKLGKVTVKSKIIKLVGKKAFSKTNKTVVFYFPNSRYRMYTTKLFKGKGQSASAVYKKK